ncbi:MAG: choice-of-anchor B family protein [Flavobacteriales bacterium]
MKQGLFISFLFLFFGLTAQEIKNVRLLDHWFSDTIMTSSSQVRFSSCWAFVQNGKEYGVIGSTEGAHIFELTDQDSLRFVDFVPGRFQSAQVITREYKHYQQYLYAICDEGPSSLQIIDLSYLPDSVHLVADLQDQYFGKSHNLFIDSTNARLYLTLVNPIVGGNELGIVPLRMYSLANPILPTLLWEGPNDIPEVHDLYVKNNRAILNCGFDGIRIYDFTNPSNPQYLNNIAYYPQQGYNHQGWLSPDEKTYVFADETAGLPIKKCRYSSNGQIQVQQFFGTENTPYSKTAHNVHITNEFAFVSYYNDGLRIFDLRKNPPTEIGVYDTYIDNEHTNGFSMWGAWGVHALLPSQRILVSDRNNGFFLFEFDRSKFLIPSTDQVQVYPNPSSFGEEVFVRLPNDEVAAFHLNVLDASGNQLLDTDIQEQSYASLPMDFAAGCYFIRVSWLNYLGESQTEVKKWIKYD